MRWVKKPAAMFVAVAAVAAAGGAGAACAGLVGRGAGDDDAVPLNVVWVIVDDLGWRDLGVYGSTFYETPNIDRLAAEGVRFSEFYTASPVCSPTRASFMSGKHPARIGITNWIGGEQNGLLLQAEYERALPLEETTVGEAFREAGYTTGYIGKWHLGDGEFMPEHQGFDVTVAVNGAGQPATYFWPYHRDRRSVWDVPDLADGSEGEYLTDRLTDEAIGFLEDHASEPFFLVLSHYAVHTPLQSREALTTKYAAKAASLPAADDPAFLPEGELGVTKQRQDHPVYAGMVESTDDSVGRILDKLDELGLADSTLVVLVSDNGGLSTLVPGRSSMPTSNRPLRAGKGWLYEGGIRAPLIIKWPGVAPAGTSSSVPAVSMDLYPTLLDVAGLELRPEQHVDGASLAGVLGGAGGGSRSALEERDSLFFHFPHYHGSGNRPSGAVRIGNLKLVEWFEDGRFELYDLATDPGEARDLAAERAAEALELRDRLRTWRETVGAKMPQERPREPGAFHTGLSLRRLKAILALGSPLASASTAPTRSARLHPRPR